MRDARKRQRVHDNKDRNDAKDGQDVDDEDDCLPDDEQNLDETNYIRRESKVPDVKHSISASNQITSSREQITETTDLTSQAIINRKKIDDETEVVTTRLRRIKNTDTVSYKVVHKYLENYNIQHRNLVWKRFTNRSEFLKLDDRFREADLPRVERQQLFFKAYFKPTFDESIDIANRDAEGYKLEYLQSQQDEVSFDDRATIHQDIKFHQDLKQSETPYRDRCLGEFMSLAMLVGKSYDHLDIEILEVKRTPRMFKEIETWRDNVSSDKKIPDDLYNPFMVHIRFSYAQPGCNTISYQVPILAWNVYHAKPFSNSHEINRRIQEAFNAEFTAQTIDALPEQFRPKHTAELQLLAARFQKEADAIRGKRFNNRTEQLNHVDTILKLQYEYDKWNEMANADSHKKGVPLNLIHSELEIISEDCRKQLQEFYEKVCPYAKPKKKKRKRSDYLQDEDDSDSDFPTPDSSDAGNSDDDNELYASFEDVRRMVLGR